MVIDVYSFVILVASHSMPNDRSFSPLELKIDTQFTFHSVTTTSPLWLNVIPQPMYIADTSNHRVQVLNSDLTFSSSFGKYGSGKGQFDDPHDIACDRTGKVYVADRDNDRIQILTAEGKFFRMFGEGRGELYCLVT